jgi:PAS domain S-box-containing protein
MFGCKKRDLIGTNISELPWFDGRTVKRITSLLLSLEKNEPSLDLIELELKNTEKKKIFAEASITALTDKNSVTGFLMVIRNISERKKIEQRLAHTLAQLKKEQRQLESLTKKIITAQEQERLYLASEIHDDLLQGIVAILYFFQMIDTSSLDDKTRERKEKLVQIIKSSIERGRSLIREIEPIREQDIDLVQAIKNSIELRFSGTETTVQFDHPDILPRFSSAVETNILRIVQEALMNIYKHANATSVNIQLNQNKKTLTIEIADNGVGFSKRTAAKKAAGHYGLLSMQERAHLINGSLSIKSKLSKGTTIRCTFPTERSEYGWTK